MDAVSDDPDTIEDFKEIAHTLHLPPQIVAGIFFGAFIFVCMAVSLGCWYMHHRYAQAQKRATIMPGALERGIKSSKISLGEKGDWSPTSSTRTLLPTRLPRVVVSSRSEPDLPGRTNSTITLVDDCGLTPPKDASIRGSKTYSLTLLDFYASMDDYLPYSKSMNGSRSQTL